MSTDPEDGSSQLPPLTELLGTPGCSARRSRSGAAPCPQSGRDQRGAAAGGSGGLAADFKASAPPPPPPASANSTVQGGGSWGAAPAAADARPAGREAGARDPETSRPEPPGAAGRALRRPQERHLPGGSRPARGGRGRTVWEGGRGGSGAACRPRGSAPPGPPTALV